MQLKLNKTIILLRITNDIMNIQTEGLEVIKKNTKSRLLILGFNSKLNDFIICYNFIN